jgi:hypothetical protein
MGMIQCMAEKTNSPGRTTGFGRGRNRDASSKCLCMIARLLFPKRFQQRKASVGHGFRHARPEQLLRAS